jgi:hypothetical protein
LGRTPWSTQTPLLWNPNPLTGWVLRILAGRPGVDGQGTALESGADAKFRTRPSWPLPPGDRLRGRLRTHQCQSDPGGSCGYWTGWQQWSGLAKRDAKTVGVLVHHSLFLTIMRWTHRSLLVKSGKVILRQSVWDEQEVPAWDECRTRHVRSTESRSIL